MHSRSSLSAGAVRQPLSVRCHSQAIPTAPTQHKLGIQTSKNTTFKGGLDAWSLRSRKVGRTVGGPQDFQCGDRASGDCDLSRLSEYLSIFLTTIMAPSSFSLRIQHGKPTAFCKCIAMYSLLDRYYWRLRPSQALCGSRSRS